MKEKDIDKILQGMKIPEPDEAVKQATIKASVDEFNRQKQSLEKKVKGIEDERRLIGNIQNFLNFLGGFAMKRSFVITSSATAFTIALVVGLTYLSVYRNDLTEQNIVSPAVNETTGKTVSELLQATSTGEEGVSKESMAAPAIGTGLGSLSDVGGLSGVISMDSDVSESYERPVTGRDQFESISTNPLTQVKEEPVSTFSIDVDTSSYAFARRQINKGMLPQKDAVRIEEMINYFDYDYAVPGDKSKPFQPTIAVYPTPWNQNTKLLHIGIKGYDIVPEKKPQSNLVFLLDVSGSMMYEDKLPLLKNSFRMFVNTLDEEDTVAIVVYAGASGTVLEPTSVKEKGKILAALDQLEAGGSTAGGEGIRRAYDLAEANFAKDGVNRVILATDGDFNVGIRDTDELKSFIERKRQSGVFLSVLGFGQGNYYDALMQKLAQNGNGNAAYIDSLNEARKVLVDEASSTLFVIARDVKIQIEFNPELIAEYRLIGYESRMLKREDFNNDKVDAGDIGSGHTVTAIYEITPVGSKGRMVDDLRYGDKASKEVETESFGNEFAFLKIRYKLPDSDTSELITAPVKAENEYANLEQVPVDIRFAASVAAFGQLLRGGTYTGEFAYKDVIELAELAVGKDGFGYRHEFINLVRLAEANQ